MKNKTIVILQNRTGMQLAELILKYCSFPFLVPNLLAKVGGRHREFASKAGLNKALLASIRLACIVTLRQLSFRIDTKSQPPKLGPFIQAIHPRLT